MRLKFILFVVGASALASANSVSPNHLGNTDGNSFFNFTVEGNSSRLYQSVISANQLTSLVGQNILGLAWRLDSDAVEWPVIGGTIAEFDIRIGEGVDPSETSMTFSENFTNGSTLVRSGALTISPGEFSVGGSPNAWGPTIYFDTPYVYMGGNLTVEYRFTGMPLGAGQARLDASAEGEEGFMSDYAAVWNWGGASTSWLAPDENRAIVTQFSASPVPEPATLAALGIGGVALFSRRRKGKR